MGNLPKEDDTQQLTKFLNRRKSEWGTTDIRGVFLVNHQLGIRPLKRNNRGVFTHAQIRDACLDHVTLMTTWELFQLVRGMERWAWPPEAVQDVFYRDGRTAQIPSHWKALGKVAHYYDKIAVVSIEISGTRELRRGDIVGYAFADGFEQETITSLETDKQPVETALPGQRVGFKTTFPRNRLPDGFEVYVANTTGSPPSLQLEHSSGLAEDAGEPPHGVQ
jgi:hypothetical protein